MRNNLLSLQEVSARLEKTQHRLSTGLKVNSALDNPTDYFAAVGSRNLAQDLNARKDGISEAIQTVASANAGISAINTLLQTASGVANQALSDTNQTDRDSFAKTFNQIMKQIDFLSSDSGYRGTNLTTNSTLTVNLAGQSGQSTLSVAGTSLDSASLGISEITIPPISPFFNSPPDTQVDWKAVRSQVLISFDNGDGSNVNNIVPGSVQVLDASNQPVTPYAQYKDPLSGTISFFFTTPPTGDSYHATWDVALNENKFNFAFAQTNVRQVLVDNVPSNADTSIANGNLSIQFAQGIGPGQTISVTSVTGHVPIIGTPIVSLTLQQPGSYPRAESSAAVTTGSPAIVWPTQQIRQSLSQVDTAISTLRTTATSLNSASTVLTVRNDFLQSMSNILNTGADNLTLADMNEEGANMLMLNTQLNLGTQSLSMASKSAQQVLKMFG